ncbi:hypothetical protein BC332_08093 [Capsicum chinense]|nr:hypothetical protein BC332_08093 [Capsicum chinense]
MTDLGALIQQWVVMHEWWSLVILVALSPLLVLQERWSSETPVALVLILEISWYLLHLFRLKLETHVRGYVRISWMYWFKKILYHQVALVYVLTKLVTNVSQAFLDFDVINDLQIRLSSKALIVGSMASTSIRNSIPSLSNSNFEIFDGKDFPRWRGKMKFFLRRLKLAYVLEGSFPNAPSSDVASDEATLIKEQISK